MIQIIWQDQRLSVNRLVFRHGHETAFDATLDRLAARFRLELSDDLTEPRPGDFWLGCHPRTGWGSGNPERIGWASAVEVPLAVGVLKYTAEATEPLADAPAPAVAFG